MLNFKWLFFNNLEKPVSRTFLETKIGLRFLGPKGANCLSILQNLGEMLFRFNNAVTFILGVSGSLPVFWHTIFSKAISKFFIFSISNVSPAAKACPPKLIKKSLQSWIASWILKLGIDRADPVATPLDSVKIIVGRW